MSRGLRRVARHWRTLGTADPLWAVYVAPDTQHGGWDVEKFFETGRGEVAGVLSELAVTSRARRTGLALDFGCGVGRLTRALAAHFDRVIGVDVSEPMLLQARQFQSQRLEPATGGEIEFVLNERADLSMIADSSLDLIYTSLVFQHLPRPLAVGYLREFVRTLRPDGVAVVQVATRPTISLKGLAFLVLPAAVTGFLQRRLLEYPAPMRMQAMPTWWIRRNVTAAGGRIVASNPDASYGGHWIYTRFVIERIEEPIRA